MLREIGQATFGFVPTTVYEFNKPPRMDEVGWALEEYPSYQVASAPVESGTVADSVMLGIVAVRRENPPYMLGNHWGPWQRIGYDDLRAVVRDFGDGPHDAYDVVAEWDRRRA